MFARRGGKVCLKPPIFVVFVPRRASPRFEFSRSQQGRSRKTLGSKGGRGGDDETPRRGTVVLVETPAETPLPESTLAGIA